MPLVLREGNLVDFSIGVGAALFSVSVCSFLLSEASSVAIDVLV